MRERSYFVKTRTITGTPSEILVEQLVASGVKYVFYNSGSREALFFDALHSNPNIHGILALHEGNVTSMAGGYTQVHNQPAVMVVHLGAGLAQAMGQFINVAYGGLPVVVITFAGDTGSWVDRINLDFDHSFAPTSVARPVVKASWTVIDPEGLPAAVERALQVAQTPPFGPVHLAVYDSMLSDKQVTVDILDDPVSPLSAGNASDTDLDTILGYLDSSERPLIYAGDGVWRNSGEELAGELAIHFGAAVCGTNVDYRGISIKHPQHLGEFDGAWPEYDPDLIFCLGVKHQGTGYASDHAPFRRLREQGGNIIALGSSQPYITNYPGLDLAVLGDEKDALRRLLEKATSNFPISGYITKRTSAITASKKRRERSRNAMMPEPVEGLVRPGLLIDILDKELEAMGGGIVTNENSTASQEAIPSGDPPFLNTYIRQAGGSEGWGVGAAMGAKLASGDVPVVGFVGDGSLYYAESGLWTAVHHNIPVLFVITNNVAYGIVAGFFDKAGGQMSDTGKFAGVSLEGIEPVKIANAFGMDGETVQNEADLEDSLRRGLEIVNTEGRPYLIDVRLPSGLPEGGVPAEQYRMR